MTAPFPDVHQSSYIRVGRELMNNLSAQLGSVSETMMSNDWRLDIFGKDGRLAQQGVVAGAMRRKGAQQAVFVPLVANYSSKEQEEEFGEVLTIVIYKDEPEGSKTRRTSHHIVCEDDMAHLPA